MAVHLKAQHVIKRLLQDQGLDCIVYDEDADTPAGRDPFLTATPKVFVCNSAGHIVDVGVPGAIPICKAWGIQFWIVPREWASIKFDLFIQLGRFPSPKATDSIDETTTEVAYIMS